MMQSQHIVGMEKTSTHTVSNQFDELQDYNLFETDTILKEILHHYHSELQAEHSAFGETVGRASFFQAADLANRHTPELNRFDARGRRIDQVEFHPAWHQIMQTNRQFNVHGYPFITQPFIQSNDGQKNSAWVDWATKFYLTGQVEAGNLCPHAMTLGCIPLLQREPKLWAEIGDKLLSSEYDARDMPIAEKKSIWVGMGMTEKQGGSDGRANQPLAKPIDKTGRGEAYLLTGHKWFFSVPMSDAHLVVAQTEHEGIGCFFVPRRRSNSSSEVEFQNAWGIMIGEEGRGIPTIIEMANYTRLTCSVGSTAILRQALVQCLAYTRQRQTFGKALAEQPLMQAVLADLALETEAALQLSMHLASHYDLMAEQNHANENALSQAWIRLMTPAAKFWICKRAVELAGEAMEVFGGNGYVDNGIMARLFRETPVNTIWEGSGNIMCLDVLRAMKRESELIEILLASFSEECASHAILKIERSKLYEMLILPPDQLQFQARTLVIRLVLLAQSVLMVRYSESYVAEAFIQSRYSAMHGRVVGMLNLSQADLQRLFERALAS